jgi:hypothetical protein
MDASVNLGRHDATNLEQAAQVHVRGTRVFTTEFTESTEGMRRKAIFGKGSSK